MSESVYLAPRKIHAENEQEPLTSNYSPIHLQGVSDSNKNEIANEDTDQTLTVVTDEPTSHPSKKSWSPLTANGRFQTTTDSSLVLLESDSENEIFPTLIHAANKYQANEQLTLQLAKDGYELDRVPDNEHIDLIPPAAGLSDLQACTCCQVADASCVIS